MTSSGTAILDVYCEDNPEGEEYEISAIKVLKLNHYLNILEDFVGDVWGIYDKKETEEGSKF